jgi:hypothetical protein
MIASLIALIAELPACRLKTRLPVYIDVIVMYVLAQLYLDILYI